MDDCIFCKIIRGEIPSSRLYEDDEILAIRDIKPQTPVHVLIMPKRHIPSLLVTGNGDESLLGRLMLRASEVARQEGLEKNGARFVINSGAHACQSVGHLHVHVMGGRQMGLNQA